MQLQDIVASQKSTGTRQQVEINLTDGKFC